MEGRNIFSLINSKLPLFLKWCLNEIKIWVKFFLKNTHGALEFDIYFHIQTIYDLNKKASTSSSPRLQHISAWTS